MGRKVKTGGGDIVDVSVYTKVNGDIVLLEGKKPKDPVDPPVDPPPAEEDVYLTSTSTKFNLDFLRAREAKTEKTRYKVAEDAFPKSPEGWSRVITNKNAFMVDTATNVLPLPYMFYCTDFTPGQPVQDHTMIDNKETSRARVHASGLYSFVKNDVAVKQRLKQQIMAQINVPSVQFQNTNEWKIDNTIWNIDNNNTWGFGVHIYTMDNAFQYSKHTEAGSTPVWSNAEIAQYYTWSKAFAKYIVTSVNKFFLNIFPKRMDDDYSTIGRKDSPLVLYMYRNAQGQAVNGHTSLSYMRYMNNRRSAALLAALKIALQHPGDAGMEALIPDIKRYFREWITYGMWGDGMIAEFHRGTLTVESLNIGDHKPDQGSAYACDQYFFCGWMAELLARHRGDYSLYEFKTKQGANGTQSTTDKSLFLGLNHILNYIDGTYSGANARYCTVDPAKVGDPLYLMDMKDQIKPDGTSNGWHCNLDVIVQPFNNYYKSERFRKAYRREPPFRARTKVNEAGGGSFFPDYLAFGYAASVGFEYGDRDGNFDRLTNPTPYING